MGELLLPGQNVLPKIVLVDQYESGSCCCYRGCCDDFVSAVSFAVAEVVVAQFDFQPRKIEEVPEYQSSQHLEPMIEFPS